MQQWGCWLKISKAPSTSTQQPSAALLVWKNAAVDHCQTNAALVLLLHSTAAPNHAPTVTASDLLTTS
jgi:hypothetical protein